MENNKNVESEKLFNDLVSFIKKEGVKKSDGDLDIYSHENVIYQERKENIESTTYSSEKIMLDGDMIGGRLFNDEDGHSYYKIDLDKIKSLNIKPDKKRTNRYRR